MILTPYELPSNGLDPNSESISIKGLGFQQLIEYSKEYENAKTDLDKFTVDYNWTKKIISDWQHINLVDLDSIILKWKLESVNEGNTFSVVKTCPHCGHKQTLELSLEQLGSFAPINYALTGEIELGGTRYQYECPSLDYFDDVFTKITKYKQVHYINLIKLISMIPEFSRKPNQVQSAVVNAKLSDIQVLRTLESIYLNSNITINTHCSNCGGGDWSMSVLSLIDNPFLSLVINCQSFKDKVILGEIRRDNESGEV